MLKDKAAENISKYIPEAFISDFACHESHLRHRPACLQVLASSRGFADPEHNHWTGGAC